MSKGININGKNGSVTILPNDEKDVKIILPDGGGDLLGKDEVNLILKNNAIAIAGATKMVAKPVILLAEGEATDFKGNIRLAPLSIAGNYTGTHESTDYQVSLNAEFTNLIVDAVEDKVNLLSLSVTVGLNVTYYIRARFHTDVFESEWSDTILVESKGVVINAPQIYNTQLEVEPTSAYDNIHIFIRGVENTGIVLSEIASVIVTLEFATTTDFASVAFLKNLDWTTYIKNGLSPVDGGTHSLQALADADINPYGITLYVRGKITYSFNDGSIIASPFSNTAAHVTENVLKTIQLEPNWPGGLDEGTMFKCAILNYHPEYEYALTTTAGTVSRNGKYVFVDPMFVPADTYISVTIKALDTRFNVSSELMYVNFTVRDVPVAGTINMAFSDNGMYNMGAGNLSVVETHTGTGMTTGAKYLDAMNHEQISTIDKLYIDGRGNALRPNDVLVDELGRDIIIESVVDDGVREYVFDADTEIYEEKFIKKSNGTLYYNSSYDFNLPINKLDTTGTMNSFDGRSVLFTKLPFRGKYYCPISGINAYAVDLDNVLWVLGNITAFPLAEGYTNTIGINNSWKKTTITLRHWHARSIVTDDGKLIDIYNTTETYTVLATNVNMVAIGESISTTGYIDNQGYLWLKGANNFGQIGNGTTIDVSEFTNTGQLAQAAYIYGADTSLATFIIDGDNNLLVAGVNIDNCFSKLLATTTMYLAFTDIGVKASKIAFLKMSGTLYGIVIIQPDSMGLISLKTNYNFPYISNTTERYNTLPIPVNDANYWAVRANDGLWYSSQHRANYFTLSETGDNPVEGDVFTSIIDSHPRTPNLYVVPKSLPTANIPKRLSRTDVYFETEVSNTIKVKTASVMTIKEVAASILHHATDMNSLSSLRINGSKSDIVVGTKVVSNTGEVRTVSGISKSTLTPATANKHLMHAIATDANPSNAFGTMDQLGILQTAGSANYRLTGLGAVSSYYKKLTTPLFKKVVCNGEGTIGLGIDGLVYVCGINTNGATGQGSSTDSASTFTVLSGISDVVDVVAGYKFFAVLTTSGKVYASGVNDSGSLGLGDTPIYWSLTEVPVPATIKFIVAGTKGLCAIDTDNTVYFTGSADYGLFPINLTAFTMIGLKAVDVSLGHNSFLVIGEDGYMWTSGTADYVGNLNASGTVLFKTDIKPKRIFAGYNCAAYTDDVDNLYFTGEAASSKIISTTTAFPAFTFIIGNVKEFSATNRTTMITMGTGEVFGAGDNKNKLSNDSAATFSLFKPLHSNTTSDFYNGICNMYDFRDKYYDTYTITVDTPFTAIPTALYQIPEVTCKNDGTEFELNTVSFSTATYLYLTTTFKAKEFLPRYSFAFGVRTHRQFTCSAISCTLGTIA